MKEIDISKHTRFSLELIFSEANKLLDHTLNSIFEIRNKSFWLFAFISSLCSFSFVKIVETNYDYFAILIGTIISGIVLRKNLFPQTIQFSGALPEHMIDSYFDNYKNEVLDKEYLATQIQSYNDAMNLNKSLIKKMVERFKRSFWIVLISFLLFALIFLFRLIEGLPT